MAKLRVFFIAGEASGDYCGSELIGSLKKKFQGDLVLGGVGGMYMAQEGVDSIFPISQISVMGIAEIIPSIFKIATLITKTAKAAIEFNPDIVVTIDSPGFCFRVIKKIMSLKKTGTKFVHYVSPSVWVYKKDRVYEMAKHYDLVLALLPFESKYYKGTGLRCEYVGHHLVENDWQKKGSIKFRKKYSIPKSKKLIGVLPGSRETEVRKNLPCFISAINEFLYAQKNKKNFMIIYPAVSDSIMQIIGSHEGKMCFDYKIIRNKSYEEKIEMLTSLDMALVKSGTSSLELVFANVPMVVAYRVNWFTAFIARNIYKIFQNVKFVSLANIILNKEVIPEFLQEKCTPSNISLGLTRLSNDKFRSKQLLDYKKVIIKLSPSGSEKPSEIAARKIIELQT